MRQAQTRVHPQGEAGPASLETSRLAMRRLRADDAAFYLALVTDPDWIRFIGDKKLSTLEQARKSLEDGPIAAYARTGHGLLAVERRGEGVPLGICGLIKRDTLPDVDLGFAFLPQHRRQGYAEESARATLEHARHVLGLRRVVGITSPENDASGRLLEKLGMRLERTFTMPGETRLTRLYAIEWP